MTEARKYVAEAIQLSEECGGLGILTDDEIAALEWAVHAEYQDPETKDHRITLAGLLGALGNNTLRLHGITSRVDAYYLKCADLAIGKYEEWLDQKTKDRT